MNPTSKQSKATWHNIVNENVPKTWSKVDMAGIREKLFNLKFAYGRIKHDKNFDYVQAHFPSLLRLFQDRTNEPESEQRSQPVQEQQPRSEPRQYQEQLGLF